MNKQLNTKLLIDETQQLISDYHCAVSDKMIEAKEHLEISSGMFASLQNQSFHLFDLDKGFFISTNSTHHDKLLKLALTPQQPPDYALLNEITHPDDINFSLKFELTALRFLMQLPAKRVKEFTAVYLRRLMTKSGKCEYFSISYKVALCDEKGNPWLILMHCRHLPLRLPNNKTDYRIISIKPYNMIRKSKLFDRKEFCYLTQREMEVIVEINKGFDKGAIAERLHISLQTIKSHCKNIAKKSGLSNIHQACHQIDRMGMISD